MAADDSGGVSAADAGIKSQRNSKDDHTSYLCMRMFLLSDLQDHCNSLVSLSMIFIEDDSQFQNTFIYGNFECNWKKCIHRNRNWCFL